MIMEAGSPQICVVSRQGGDPGQPVVSLQSESKGLRTRGGDVSWPFTSIIFNHHSNQKVWETLLLPYWTDEKTEIWKG